jgi:hypothetical protein
VAAWAGHLVEVLVRIYAKCLDGGDVAARQRVQAALGHKILAITALRLTGTTNIAAGTRHHARNPTRPLHVLKAL